MSRQVLRLLVSTLLLISMAVTVLSGLVAEALDLNRFVYHRYPGYLAAVLFVVHVVLNSRGYLSRWPIGPRARGDRGRTLPVVEMEASTGGRVSLTGTGGTVRRRDLLMAGAAGAVGLLAGWLTSPKPWLAASFGGDLGSLYHDWSKPAYTGILAGILGREDGSMRAGGTGGAVPLPGDFSDQGMSLEKAIEQRRSIRSYARTPMSLLQLSRLLHRAGGITDPGSGYRAAPSAGALYPLEVYAFANNVEGLDRGAYRYEPKGHSLESLRPGDHGQRLLVASLGQDMVLRASVVLVLAAVFERTRRKYRERTYRYVLLECGHVAQNVYLAATSMGLGACAIGAFLDDELNGMLGLDGEEQAALYILPVGTR